MGDARPAGGFALATALALAAGALVVDSAGAEGLYRDGALPPHFLPRVDAPPPSAATSGARVWEEEDEPPASRSYYAPEDRRADALKKERKGRWRYLKYDFDMQVGDDEYHVRVRAPSKKAVKKRLLSAGVEIRF